MWSLAPVSAIAALIRICVGAPRARWARDCERAFARRRFSTGNDLGALGAEPASALPRLFPLAGVIAGLRPHVHGLKRYDVVIIGDVVKLQKPRNAINIGRHTLMRPISDRTPVVRIGITRTITVNMAMEPWLGRVPRVRPQRGPTLTILRSQILGKPVPT